MIPEIAPACGYNTVMKLNNKQIKYLKGLAHSTKPVITVGNSGLALSVRKEIDNALSHHELIKVKLPAGGKSEKQDLVDEICKHSGATAIALTGRISIIFRQLGKDPNNKPSKINIII